MSLHPYKTTGKIISLYIHAAYRIQWNSSTFLITFPDFVFVFFVVARSAISEHTGFHFVCMFQLGTTGQISVEYDTNVERLH